MINGTSDGQPATPGYKSEPGCSTGETKTSKGKLIDELSSFIEEQLRKAKDGIMVDVAELLQSIDYSHKKSKETKPNQNPLEIGDDNEDVIILDHINKANEEESYIEVTYEKIVKEAIIEIDLTTENKTITKSVVEIIQTTEESCNDAPKIQETSISIEKKEKVNLGDIKETSSLPNKSRDGVVDSLIETEKAVEVNKTVEQCVSQPLQVIPPAVQPPIGLVISQPQQIPEQQQQNFTLQNRDSQQSPPVVQQSRTFSSSTPPIPVFSHGTNQFPNKTQSYVQPIPVPLRLPLKTQSYVQPIPVPLRLPLKTQSYVQPIPVPLRFPLTTKSFVQPVPPLLSLPKIQKPTRFSSPILNPNISQGEPANVKRFTEATPEQNTSNNNQFILRPESQPPTLPKKLRVVVVPTKHLANKNRILKIIPVKKSHNQQLPPNTNVKPHHIVNPLSKYSQQTLPQIPPQQANMVGVGPDGPVQMFRIGNQQQNMPSMPKHTTRYKPPPPHLTAPPQLRPIAQQKSEENNKLSREIPEPYQVLATLLPNKSSWVFNQQAENGQN